MYLLDTNIVSERRRARPHGGVLAWLKSIRDEALLVSVVTIGEIQAGVEITRERDKAKAAEIEAWLERVLQTYNLVPMDARVFRVWAQLMHRRSGQLIDNAMIAATAAVHNLIVVTRNVRDFDGLGVRTVNPFDFSGED